MTEPVAGFSKDFVSALKLGQVSKHYGAVQVIDKLSLEIEHGEFIVVLGPSGCGKTTLLRIVAGLEEVTDGKVFIDGKDCTLAPPGHRNLAMVFQHYALYPHMTVRDNLAFGLRNMGVKSDEISRRITESARMLELTALLDRKPDQLSGGQRQRVAIGRAVIKAPGIVLFDEPLSNLDASLRGRTRVELAQLHRRLGTTMVFVTHDQLDAMTLATRIVVMNGGVIEQVGTPVEVYRRPATRFVASFIGTPGMNFIAVTRCGAEAGRTVVRLPDGTILTTRVPDHSLPGHDEMSLGVRPENLHVAADGVLVGRVEMVEFLGERSLAVLRLADGSLLTITLKGINPTLGQTVRAAIDLRETHLFDASGQAHHADRDAR